MVDVVGPTQPLLLGSVELPSDVVSLAVVGDFVYCSGRDMHIIDASDPGQPREVGNVGLAFYTGAGRAVAYGQTIFAKGGFGERGCCFRVFDVTNPTEPAVAFTYDTYDRAWQVVPSDGYVYVADSFGGLVILQMTGSWPPAPPARTAAPRASATATATATTMPPTPARPQATVYLPLCQQP